MLILASASPRRREILQQIGVLFEVYAADIDETPLEKESAKALVRRLSKNKALAVQQQYPNDCILASDTVVVGAKGHIYGKPESQEHAVNMLMSLSGTTHQVVTGVVCCLRDELEVSYSQTWVTMRPFTREEAIAYWHTKEPLGKAGGYAIQGFGAALINKIEGSYTGVVGLPVEVLVPMLQKFNIAIWNIMEKGIKS